MGASLISSYACRCPIGPASQWTGFLCDRCFASIRGNTVCRGDCDAERLKAYNYTSDNFENAVIMKGEDRICNKVCLPNGGTSDCGALSRDLGYNGECEACNGHGSCTEEGKCECEGGWFDKDGLNCFAACVDEKGEPLCGKNAYCLFIGGMPRCRCKPGWFNEPECDISCPGINPVTGEGYPCNGHGACFYNGDFDIIEL